MAMSSRSAKDRYRPDTVGAREGFTPPACRNHRAPTANDTPISNAASSELAPCAIAAQNWTRSCRHATVGRPGEGICPRYSCTARCRSRTVAINTSIDKVLRRPVESALRPLIRMMNQPVVDQAAAPHRQLDRADGQLGGGVLTHRMPDRQPGAAIDDR